MFLRAYLNVYYVNDSIRCVMSTYSRYPRDDQSVSWRIRELSSYLLQLSVLDKWPWQHNHGQQVWVRRDVDARGGHLYIEWAVVWPVPSFRVLQVLNYCTSLLCCIYGCFSSIQHFPRESFPYNRKPWNLAMRSKRQHIVW